MERVQAFDLEALAEVYDTYSPGLYAYAMRRLGDPAQAEECVAETFHRFLQALRLGKGPRHYLQAYLYRIAHNWITDCYRRTPPPALELDRDGGPAGHEALASGGETLEQQAARSLEREQVRLALRCLTPDQQQVIALKYLEGWDNEAVARALDKPVGAVKSLQHRAVAALRRMLHPDTEGERYETTG